ncbi:MAG: EamA family transporter [Armatimonadota bacterium]|nr:EamA family transporter [Armatimonadota bacterium]MDR5702538.1 EamA family transporter [Armatimonadota bacterium]MDR7434472.1 EamA family transporter [Armatimonadota bacterium]
MRTTLLPALFILLLWGTWPLFAKVSVGRLGMPALFWSQVSGLLVVGLYLLWTRHAWVVNDPVGFAASVLGGVTVATGSLLFYHLLRKHPTAVIVFLTGLYPVVSLLLAWLLLHERVSAVQMAGILLALAALILLTR